MERRHALENACECAEGGTGYERFDVGKCRTICYHKLTIL